ncbi:tyrosine-type recombinase/integrase [Cellulosilyticum sp. I15G10I2]|uniref:tyrosine-type recombinase/integrase n=1 Tax=Cellulosilyticum sp. I15G10I2 TaxID=1892843 RepID=UPI00085C81D6|nr:tyrosine-type recombinase/integrase [Cellulosilyticum sp. I15G10I2]
MAWSKVYSPEKWEVANKENKELLKDYLVELRAERLKDSTLKQYRDDGRMILCYIQSEMENRSILAFTRKDFRNIALWLTDERKVSNARFNRVFSILHGMMEYAEDDEDYSYEQNEARKIKRLPRQPVREIYFLSDTQIHKIRNYLLENRKYRECAYLDISYDSAARISEVNQIKKSDILSMRYTNTVVGKMGKKFNLLYHKNSLESLSLYLQQRGGDDEDALWVSMRGTKRTRLKNSALYDWTKKMTKILNLLEGKNLNFSPHSFRHSALQNYRDGTHYMCKEMATPRIFTMEELQALAHHDSMETTRSYLKSDESSVIERMFDIKFS